MRSIVFCLKAVDKLEPILIGRYHGNQICPSLPEDQDRLLKLKKGETMLRRRKRHLEIPTPRAAQPLLAAVGFFMRPQHRLCGIDDVQERGRPADTTPPKRLVEQRAK